MSVNHPREIHETFEKGVNENDIEGLMELYDVDGIAVELDGSECTGPEAMRAMFVGLTGAIRSIKGTTRKLFVSDDVALGSAAWTAEIVLPDGSVITQTGTTAEVSRRQADGTWKVVIDDPMFV